MFKSILFNSDENDAASGQNGSRVASAQRATADENPDEQGANGSVAPSAQPSAQPSALPSAQPSAHPQTAQPPQSDSRRSEHQPEQQQVGPDGQPIERQPSATPIPPPPRTVRSYDKLVIKIKGT